MRQTMLLLATISLVPLVGCSSSSFVGQWRSTSVPETPVTERAEAVTLLITEGHNFVVSLEDAEGQQMQNLAAGTWKLQSDGTAVLQAEDVTAKAELLDPSTLLFLVDEEGIALNMRRVTPDAQARGDQR